MLKGKRTCGFGDGVCFLKPQQRKSYAPFAPHPPRSSGQEGRIGRLIFLFLKICAIQGSWLVGVNENQNMAEAIGIRARQTEAIIDRDEDDTAVIEEIVPGGVGNLCRVISNDRLIKAVRASFNKLPWQERQVLQA